MLRVGLKNRNPENAPDGYERQILEPFSQQQSDGRLPEEFGEVRKEGNGG